MAPSQPCLGLSGTRTKLSWAFNGRKLISQNSNPPPLLGAHRTSSPTTSKASQAPHPPACCCPSAQAPPSTPVPCLRPPSQTPPPLLPLAKYRWRVGGWCLGGRQGFSSQSLAGLSLAGLPCPCAGPSGLGQVQAGCWFPFGCGYRGPGPEWVRGVHSWRGPGHLCLWLT